MSLFKRYQEGGNVSHWLGGMEDEDYLLQNILSELQGYGVNISPGTPLSEIGTIGGEDIMNQIRGKFDIGSKVEMDPAMFGNIYTEEWKTLDPSYYDPMRQKTQETALDALLASQNKLKSTGFAGSGRRQQQLADIKDVYGKQLEAGEMNIDKLMTAGQTSILDKMQQSQKTGLDLRYGI